MRLKTIEPGMAIHCKTQEEKKALLEEAERIGYRWIGFMERPTNMTIHVGSTIHFHEKNENANYKHITWSEYTDGVTEFSDIILPELTAEEAIKLHAEVCKYSCMECPLYEVEGYENCDDFCFKNPEKAVEILAKWKSNHDKKEPEIETVDICRIIEIQQDGRKRCVHEETIEKPITLEVEETLKRYCMEHEGEFIAVHEVVSRVKAV